MLHFTEDISFTSSVTQADKINTQEAVTSLKVFPDTLSHLQGSNNDLSARSRLK